MPHTVDLSTPVFARIWSLHREGEESVDDILKRLLLGGWPSESRDHVAEPVGFRDVRYGVQLRDGFELFRTYRGVEFRAVAKGGRWILDDGREASSLNELSRVIGAGTENAWSNWFWLDEKGLRRKAADLRKPETVAARERPASTGHSNNSEVTWRDDVVAALENINDEASLERIYGEVRRIRSSSGRSNPPSFEAVVRKTLEENSSDSDAFKNGPDLFCMPKGKGAGIWALRKRRR